jgi:hypothetical protein
MKKFQYPGKEMSSGGYIFSHKSNEHEILSLGQGRTKTRGYETRYCVAVVIKGAAGGVE